MAICKLVIKSAVDGRESIIVRMGRLEKLEEEIRLFYREENAEVCVSLLGKKANIRRNGDYSLDLLLEEGKKSEGELGLGGSKGSVEVQTYKVAYSYEKEELNLILKYHLLFGADAQKMQLNIQAKTRGTL